MQFLPHRTPSTSVRKTTPNQWLYTLSTDKTKNFLRPFTPTSPPTTQLLRTYLPSFFWRFPEHFWLTRCKTEENRGYFSYTTARFQPIPSVKSLPSTPPSTIIIANPSLPSQPSPTLVNPDKFLLPRLLVLLLLLLLLINSPNIWFFRLIYMYNYI